eukprot:SM000127S26639  [mRNA]  locus=s127:156845:159386:- [translate_table: standard]
MAVAAAARPLPRVLALLLAVATAAAAMAALPAAGGEEAAPAAADGGGGGASALLSPLHLAEAQSLADTWAHIYGLSAGGIATGAGDGDGGGGGGGPPDERNVPFAPHLQYCANLTAERRALDARGWRGALPAWAEAGSHGGPNPPWIRGGEYENLPLTRRAQADLWTHQHPAACDAPGVRVAILEWPTNDDGGPAAEIHAVAGAMSAAVAAGRLVVLANNWEAAKHSECAGELSGRWECYFQPPVDELCGRLAMEHYLGNKQTWEGAVAAGDAIALLQAADKYVVLPTDAITSLATQWEAAKKWGSPWLTQAVSVELLGVTAELGDDVRGQAWWRAQAVRYLARWPSERACRLVNQARDDAYGTRVAQELRITERLQGELRDDMDSDPASADMERPPDINFTRVGLETTVWRHAEAYIPRPIVSINIQHDDREGAPPLPELQSLDAHMWYAARLRFHVPNVRHVWLTTNSKAIIRQTSEHNGWLFWHTSEPRNLQDAAPDITVDAAFANLLISIECDYFIGSLRNPWNQLINELRVTGGRVRRGFLALEL